MIVQVPNLLSPQECDAIANGLESGKFVDGRLTAGPGAREVKNNTQLDFQRSEHGLALEKLIYQAVGRNERLSAAMLPKAWSHVLISRYDVGMRYGRHVDAPIIGQNPPIRSDASVTIFLSDPAEYEGGELTIYQSSKSQSFKLNRGDAVVYPTHFLHEVTEVTKGRRTAAVLWLQSVVRDPVKRELLFDLNRAQGQLTADPAGQTTMGAAGVEDVAALVRNSYANLLRMWADM